MGQSEGRWICTSIFHHPHELHRLWFGYDRDLITFVLFKFLWIGWTVQIDKQGWPSLSADDTVVPLVEKFVPVSSDLHQTSRHDLDQHHQPSLRYLIFLQKPIPVLAFAALHSSCVSKLMVNKSLINLFIRIWLRREGLVVGAFCRCSCTIGSQVRSAIVLISWRSV